MDTPVSMTPGPYMQNNNTLARPPRQSNAANPFPSSTNTDATRARAHLLEVPPQATAGLERTISASGHGAPSRLRRALSQLPLRTLSLFSPARAARNSADLFCTPADAGVPSFDDMRPGDAALRSTLQVDGLELATYAWGDTATQPYVLLAHDWSDHALGQHALVRALCRAGYAVVAFDQRGHGRSSGRIATLPDFVCNLLAVGWRHGPAAAVIGHGLGGTAAAIALNRGLQAERAVLISAQADPVEATVRFAASIGLAGSVRRRMVALLEQRIGMSMDELQAHRIVPRIGRPALVVHDLEDTEVPWSEGERYARCWPDARLLTTTGLGHRHIARNPQVLTACLHFLNGNAVGERVVSSPNLPHGFA